MPQLTLNNNDIGSTARNTINSNFNELYTGVNNIKTTLSSQQETVQRVSQSYILSTNFAPETPTQAFSPFNITKQQAGSQFLFEFHGGLLQVHANDRASNPDYHGDVVTYLYVGIGSPEAIRVNITSGEPVEKHYLRANYGIDYINTQHNFMYLWSPNDATFPVNSTAYFYIYGDTDGNSDFWHVIDATGGWSNTFNATITELKT